MNKRDETISADARESWGSLRGVTSDERTKKGLSESTTESVWDRYDSSREG
jgi:hypothetical protein